MNEEIKGVNLFEVNGIEYSDNIPDNFEIVVTKEQYCEYLQLKEENQQLKKENTSLRTRIKTIKRIRKKQTQKKNKYKLQIIEIQNLNQQLKDNWNELKKWLENTIEQYGGFAKYRFECVYNKMQELEGNNE